MPLLLLSLRLPLLLLSPPLPEEPPLPLGRPAAQLALLAVANRRLVERLVSAP
jgi:hypothetical protein